MHTQAAWTMLYALLLLFLLLLLHLVTCVGLAILGSLRHSGGMESSYDYIVYIFSFSYISNCLYLLFSPCIYSVLAPFS